MLIERIIQEAKQRRELEKLIFEQIHDEMMQQERDKWAEEQLAY